MPVDPYELPCQELVELVTNYLEDKLSPFDRKRFEMHLEICEACVLYLTQIRGTIQALGRLTPENIPPQAKEKLLEAFRGWKSQ